MKTWKENYSGCEVEYYLFNETNCVRFVVLKAPPCSILPGKDFWIDNIMSSNTKEITKQCNEHLDKCLDSFPKVHELDKKDNMHLPIGKKCQHCKSQMTNQDLYIS